MKYAIMYYKQTDNIGDDFQTYAAKRFLKKIDYYIDREAMDAFVPYEKEYVALIMNGWYMNNKLTWPPSPYIYPHLVSMHFTNAGLFNVGEIYLKGKVSDYLNKFEKVGCRDIETIKRLERYGVKNCYFTGCMTLTLNKFKDVEKQDYICAVDLNEKIVEKIKQSTNKPVKVITQNNYELVNMTFEERMKETEKVLKIFQGASCVITRRLHAMLPSIALETPVILLKQDGYENEKDRFQDFASFAGNTYSINDFLNMDISDIINNPNQNSEEYLDIRNNLITSCEEFIKKCDSIELDTSKLPDPKEYLELNQKDASWRDEVGSAVVEYEKAKQKEYVENWDAREKYYDSQKEYWNLQEQYWKNQQIEYEKHWGEREEFWKSYQNQTQDYIKQLQNEKERLLEDNNKMKKKIDKFYSSKLGRLYKKIYDEK